MTNVVKRIDGDYTIQSINADDSVTVQTAVLDVQAPLKVQNLTTAERDALTAENGMIIYNTTTNKFQGYENGSWANLI
jgi:hypothetical protein